MADDSDRVIPATPRRRDAARKQGARPTAAVLAGVAMAATALVLILIPLTFIDLDHRILPNKITYPSVPIAIALTAARRSNIPVANAS